MIDLDIGRGLTPWAQLGAIIAATFVSEDLTCIASGLLIRSRQLDGFVGVAGCFLGIFVGDMGLWLMGRACGRRVLDTAWVRRRVSAARIERMGDWFDRRGWTAIVAARFVPGTRLPVYLGAGMLGRRADRFVLWALLAALSRITPTGPKSGQIPAEFSPIGLDPGARTCPHGAVWTRSAERRSMNAD